MNKNNQEILDIDYREMKPGFPLSNYVESFWMLSNVSDQEKQIVILPDGRIDLIFSFEDKDDITLLGVDSEPSRAVLAPKTAMFAVSFKLLAIEYLFKDKFPVLIDTAYNLPSDYFGISIDNFEDFEGFCDLLSSKFLSILNHEIDERKRKLFDLIYNSNGEITIAEIAETIHWNSRQINRYFSQRFGISLKAYCTILRFRATFQQIKEGKLFPEQNFTDQAHFIKNIKKFSGVTPKELNKNINDRFIQLSTLKKK
ncbi:transcriptional regulator [Flavobacterium sp. JRM]|nr:transcriptional regulator [Flavobacterium sp. JRM]